MSNDPGTREVSSAAQGIKMAQIVAGISENWAVAFYKPVSQACCLWRKGKSFIQSLIFSTGFSLMAIILQHCWAPASAVALHAHFCLCKRCFSPGLLHPMATSKLTALLLELVAIHSEFLLMLSIKFLFQTNTLISIHFSTFKGFVSLECGNLYANIFGPEAHGTTTKDCCSHPCWHFFHQLKSGSHLRDISFQRVFLFHFLIASLNRSIFSHFLVFHLGNRPHIASPQKAGSR